MDDLYDKLRLLDALLSAYEKQYMANAVLPWEELERKTYLFNHIQELVEKMIIEAVK